IEPHKDATSHYVNAVSWLSMMFSLLGIKDTSFSFRKRAEEIAATADLCERTVQGFLFTAIAFYEHFVVEAPWSCMVHSRDAAQAYQDAGDRRQHCLNNTHLGKALLDLGDYVGAEAILRENLAQSERLNEAMLLASVRTFLARLLARMA